MSRLLLVATALVGLLAASANGQTFIVDRDNINDQAGAPPGAIEWYSNAGQAPGARCVKASDHQWYGDWNVDEILAYMDANPCPDGWHYQATFYMMPKGGFTLNGPDVPCKVCALWSETDWVEGTAGQTMLNFNWPKDETAATEMYAVTAYTDGDGIPSTGDEVLDVQNSVQWMFPGDPRQNTMLDCVWTNANKNLNDPWMPWMGVCKTVQNSATLDMCDADYETYVGVVLDDALFQDLLTNPDNKGLVVLDLPPFDFENKHCYTDDDPGKEPYLEIVCVPEPATMLLLAGGGLFVLLRKKR